MPRNFNKSTFMNSASGFSVHITPYSICLVISLAYRNARGGEGVFYTNCFDLSSWQLQERVRAVGLILYIRHSWKNDYDINVLLFHVLCMKKHQTTWKFRYTKIVDNMETLLRKRRYTLVQKEDFSLSSSRCHLSEKYPIIVDRLRMYDRLHIFGSILTQFEYQTLTKETITLKSQIIAYLPYFFSESSKNKEASL